ncbi:hypothetical protein ACTPEF_24315, partial [Clostridioides difficile]
LYMVMSNDYDNSSITELNLLTYNILDKSLDEDKYVLDNREKRAPVSPVSIFRFLSIFNLSSSTKAQFFIYNSRIKSKPPFNLFV